MNGKEKLYFLLDAIDDARIISPAESLLIIDPMNDLNNSIRNDELYRLFAKLTVDDKVINLIKGAKRTKSELDQFDPYDHADDGCWHIELLPSFNSYFLKIQQEPEYQEFTGKQPPVQANTGLSRKSLEKIWDVLQEIEDKRGITSSQGEIFIQQLHHSKARNEKEAESAANERRIILKKLEDDDSAIKDVHFPDDLNDSISLKIGSNYFKSYKNYENEYKKVAKEYQEQGQAINTSHNNLSLLHPDIFSKCQSLFEKAEYPEAVEKSFKVVRDRLRDLTGHETGSEAFGKGNLHVKGATAPNVDEDFNQAVKFLTMAIDMFRNEKSHTSNAKIDNPQRAYEYLTLSSLAMNLLDQAEIATA